MVEVALQRRLTKIQDFRTHDECDRPRCPDGTFDFVCTRLYLLHHLPDPETAVQEMLRGSQTGGGFLGPPLAQSGYHAGV